MRTLLFDIDGTLLLTNGGGSGAFHIALEQEFGIAQPNVNISFAGRTDRSLLAELLEINGLPGGEENQGRLRRRYTALFPDVLAKRGGTVLPGVQEVLSRLARHERVRVSVMTGNLPETATRKLEHFGLLRYIRWIIGGDLDHHRNDLAQRASELIQRKHGPGASDDVIVIGDTPADIQCGHAIGASVVAVCTGNHTRDELESESPAYVLDNLSEVAQVCEILTG